MEDVVPDSDEPPVDRVEREIRTIAAELLDSEWCTDSYLTLEEGVDIYLDEDDEEPLLEALDDLEQTLEKAYRPYREAQILQSEVTAESVAGHRILLEGIEEWLAALEMLRDEESEQEGNTDWSEALSRAEAGNRLLVAVQIFNARLQAQLAI